MFAFAKKGETSAGPGTGIVTQGLPAMSKVIPTSRC